MTLGPEIRAKLRYIVFRVYIMRKEKWYCIHDVREHTSHADTITHSWDEALAGIPAARETCPTGP